MSRKPTTRVTEKGRVCTVCNKWKRWDKFGIKTASFSGHNCRCKTCSAGMSRKWQKTSNYYQNNRGRILRRNRESYCPLRQKNNMLHSKYGITLDDFTEMYNQQNGHCKLCDCKVKKFSSNPAKKDMAIVDHDHTTGHVRGLLCNACNIALGLFHDDHNLLLKAAEYLKNDN